MINIGRMDTNIKEKISLYFKLILLNLLTTQAGLIRVIIIIPHFAEVNEICRRMSLLGYYITITVPPQ
jgi:hypothetical protein